MLKIMLLRIIIVAIFNVAEKEDALIALPVGAATNVLQLIHLVKQYRLEGVVEEEDAGVACAAAVTVASGVAVSALSVGAEQEASRRARMRMDVRFMA